MGGHRYESRGPESFIERGKAAKPQKSERSPLLSSPPSHTRGSSRRGGGRRVDAVPGGCGALEGQRGGEVTAVGRESTATGRLPRGSGHIGRGGGAVPHVG